MDILRRRFLSFCVESGDHRVILLLNAQIRLNVLGGFKKRHFNANISPAEPIHWHEFVFRGYNGNVRIIGKVADGINLLRASVELFEFFKSHAVFIDTGTNDSERIRSVEAALVFSSLQKVREIALRIYRRRETAKELSGINTFQLSHNGVRIAVLLFEPGNFLFKECAGCFAFRPIGIDRKIADHGSNHTAVHDAITHGNILRFSISHAVLNIRRRLHASLNAGFNLIIGESKHATGRSQERTGFGHRGTAIKGGIQRAIFRFAVRGFELNPFPISPFVHFPANGAVIAFLGRGHDRFFRLKSGPVNTAFKFLCKFAAEIGAVNPAVRLHGIRTPVAAALNDFAVNKTPSVFLKPLTRNKRLPKNISFFQNVVAQAVRYLVSKLLRMFSENNDVRYNVRSVPACTAKCAGRKTVRAEEFSLAGNAVPEPLKFPGRIADNSRRNDTTEQAAGTELINKPLQEVQFNLLLLAISGILGLRSAAGAAKGNIRDNGVIAVIRRGVLCHIFKRTANGHVRAGIEQRGNLRGNRVNVACFNLGCSGRCSFKNTCTTTRVKDGTAIEPHSGREIPHAGSDLSGRIILPL